MRKKCRCTIMGVKLRTISSSWMVLLSVAEPKRMQTTLSMLYRITSSKSPLVRTSCMSVHCGAPKTVSLQKRTSRTGHFLFGRGGAERERASWLCTQPPTSPVIGQPLHVYVPQESWYTYFGLFILNQAHLVTTSAASRSDSSFRLVFGCFDVFQCAVPFNN